MLIKGITLRGKTASLGGLTTQAVTTSGNKTTVSTTAGQSSAVGTNLTTSKTLKSNININKNVLNSAAIRNGLDKSVTNSIPKLFLNVPKLRIIERETFPEDVVDVSETRLKNNQFEIIEQNGISVFRPEVLAITDFQPIWDGYRPDKRRRFVDGLTPVGKLLDIQYNALWMRRDTVVSMLNTLQNSSGKATENVFNSLKTDFKEQIRRTQRTINQYSAFIKRVNSAKDGLDIRRINRASYGQGYLPLPEFFAARMQLGADEFENYSDTKILMQLLADFKSICENYSYNLLDITDSDRIDDRSPVSIDNTYTLQDGFTFSVSQLVSKAAPINAMNRDYFNGFLNSLPANPDDRIKLLVTILSKEYRVSKGLGVKNNQVILQNIFNATLNGSPFDDIIGVVGSSIFDQPLGPQSMASTLIRRIDENSFVLPFERKYVDSDETKQTYVPGSTFFIDTVFNLEGGNKFNTRPFSDYVNEFSRKFIFGQRIIENLLELNVKDTTIAPSRVIDSFLLSYKRSIAGTTTVSGFNRDQAIINALFALANEDNKLKSLLFQFILMAGLAQNNPDDKKSIYTNLANELTIIGSFPDAKISRFSNPNLNAGLRAIRPFLLRLANEIEERVFALTTVTPKIERAVTITTRPDFGRFKSDETPNTLLGSAFDRLTLQPLVAGQTTINVSKYNIRNVLMSVVEPKSSGTPNLLKEFSSLINTFTQGATVNGDNVHLLDDRSGRTRFNFVSTSTQLLLVYEILCSFVAKYNFTKFGKSQSPFNVFIKMDANMNEYVHDTIDDIVSIALVGYRNLATNVGKVSFRPKRAFTPLNTFKVSSSPLQRLKQTSRITITRNANSSKNTSNSSIVGGAASLLGTDAERKLLGQNIDSPFLGKSTLSRLGTVKLNGMFFNLKSNKLKSSIISIRNKVKEEDQTIKNILDIIAVVERRLRHTNREFQNGFSEKVLQAFLQDNLIEDLEIVRTPAQVMASKFFMEDISERRITGTVERLASDGSDRVGNAFTGIDNESDTATNFLIDEETIQPDTREVLFSLLSEPLFLIPNLADIRTKIISVGVPGGFSRQLTDRVKQSAINEGTFKDKQFDVITINVYKRDARFDDLVFKPQSFLFDLSLFAENDFDYIKPRKNETFTRLLQRARLRDLENFSGFYSGAPEFRTIENIVNSDKYDFLNREQKRLIIENHIKSVLMKLYLRLTTGMRIEETTFTNKQILSGTNFNVDFQNLIFQFLKKDLRKSIPNKPINELLEDPKVDDESKDILRLFTYGSVVFEPSILRQKIVTPKLFDRVFHIPFSTENFEVDLDLTNQTQSGKNALAQNFVQERLVTVDGKTFFKAKDRNELAFEDFFVSIENNI